MTRTKTLLLLIALLLATSAQASQQTYHWTAAPGEVHHYEVCITTDGGECITLAVEPTETTVTLEFEDNVVYTVAVRGVDNNQHPGPWSEASNPYAYTMPGQPGQPWRE